MKNLICLLILATLAANISLQAQRNSLLAEQTAYLEANALPLLQASHAMFMEALSPEERQQVTLARETIARVRAESADSDAPRSRPMQNPEAQEMLIPLRDIVEAHSSNWQEIQRDLKEPLETWQRELSAIAREATPGNEPKTAPRRRQRDRSQADAGPDSLEGSLERMLRPLPFLLWDGQEFPWQQRRR